MIRDVFEERKISIIKHLHNKVGLSIKTLKIMDKIQPIPLTQNEPLANDIIKKFEKCETEEEVLIVLRDVFELQSEYEFRNVDSMMKKIEFNSMNLFTSLNVLLKEIKNIENHEFQRDLEYIKEKIIEKKKELNDGLEETITLLSKWENKKGE